MTYEPLNRRLAMLAAMFAFLGVILGVIALSTHYWTVKGIVNESRNETIVTNNQPNGYMWNVCSF
jgi:hypothetical protein